MPAASRSASSLDMVGALTPASRVRVAREHSPSRFNNSSVSRRLIFLKVEGTASAIRLMANSLFIVASG